MTKRSGRDEFKSFERVARDFYKTPPAAVLPLLSHLPQRPFRWCEPCAGDGALVRAIADECVDARDIEPQSWFIDKGDCFSITEDLCERLRIELFITNPPWPSPGKHGEPTTGIIRHLMALRPSWFLIPADMMHNKYMAPLLRHCDRIVTVGRVKWIEGSTMSGVDNCVWYRFVPEGNQETRFYGKGILP